MHADDEGLIVKHDKLLALWRGRMDVPLAVEVHDRQGNW